MTRQHSWIPLCTTELVKSQLQHISCRHIDSSAFREEAHRTRSEHLREQLLCQRFRKLWGIHCIARVLPDPVRDVCCGLALHSKCVLSGTAINMSLLKCPHHDKTQATDVKPHEACTDADRLTPRAVLLQSCLKATGRLVMIQTSARAFGRKLWIPSRGYRLCSPYLLRISCSLPSSSRSNWRFTATVNAKKNAGDNSLSSFKSHLPGIAPCLHACTQQWSLESALKSQRKTDLGDKVQEAQASGCPGLLCSSGPLIGLQPLQQGGNELHALSTVNQGCKERPACKC